VSDLKDEKLIEKAKLHENRNMESSEYFCQMSSKLILIILSYTVSKFARFFWDTVYFLFRILAELLFDQIN